MVGGQAYVDPLRDERYRVKLFPLPTPGDLGAHIRLMESFERRFMHTADGGREAQRHVGDIDSYIDEKRASFAAAEGLTKEHEGAALCLALLDRGVRRAKEHIERRMHTTPATGAALEPLSRLVERDLVEGADLIGFVRRRRGHVDVDNVLNEMKGEPYNIFVGTMPKGNLEFFGMNRMRKAAQAMRCIDKVADTMRVIAGSHKDLEEGGVQPMLAELAESAKTRVQLQRDDPDFVAADARLHIARDALMNFAPKKSGNAPTLGLTHLPAGYGAKGVVSPTTLALLRDAADLMFDIAIVRVPREVSAADLTARVVEHASSLGKFRAPGS